MKASELRIGNYVKCDSIPEVGILKISVINKDFVNGCNIELIKPIPLTEEWLLKFGFDKWNDYCYCNGKIAVEGLFKKFNESICLLRCGNDDYVELTNIKHVHQLQNLYFALTNEELTYEQQK